MTENRQIVVPLDKLPEAIAAAKAAEASGASPQLDGIETSLPSQPPTSYRDFMIKGVERDWNNAEWLYATTDAQGKTHRASQLAQCRSHAYFYGHKTERTVKVISSRCGLRWCPLCIRTKRYIITGSVKRWLESRKRPKFLTFTLAHSSAKLSDQIDKLYKSFILLRRRPLFKKAIRGGVWFFQLTISKADGLYHPHLHCVCDGLYIDKFALSAEWKHCSKSSQIVDIKAVKDTKKVAEYVARYATAPCRMVDFSDDRQVEVFEALHGRRICGTWGSGTEIKMKPTEPADTGEWVKLSSFWDVIGWKDSRINESLIFNCWKKNEPLPDIFEFPRPPTKFEPVPGVREEMAYKQFLFEWSRSI